MPTNNLSAIPAELRELKQWILWKYEDKGGLKPTKVPYDTNNNLASVTNPNSWCDFNTAFNVYSLGGFDGLGFVFTEKDPYAFIDLDHTTDKADYERQLRVSREFNSYSEVSPSGQGLHIIVKGSIPQGRKRSSIEIYSSGRYATMTGSVYENKPIADRHDLLNMLFQQMGGPPNVNSNVDEPQVDDDAKIIEMAKSARNGDKFNELFTGTWNSYYPTQSEADFALVDIIAFYTQNRNQIERIFKASALGKRDKAKRKDYIGYMINKSFDRMLPKLDMEGWKIALEDAISYQNDKQLEMNLAVSDKGSPTAFDAASGGSNPSTATNGSVAQRLVPTPHKSTDVGSNPTASTKLLPPPGLVGEIAQFIYQAAPRPVPEMALAGSLGLMAGICGRAYNISGTGLNQYVLLLAQTGTGKEQIASGIDKLINAVQLSVPVASEFIGPSEIASGQALIKFLSHSSQSFVSLLGEFGLRMQIITHPHANAADKTFKRMILDLYNKSGYGQVARPSIYSDKDKNTASISSPAFSIIGESTPETFYNVLNEEMIAEGLLPRFSIIEYNGIRPKLNYEAVYVQPSIALVEKLASLMANAKTVMANRKVINITSTEEADKALKQFDELADDKINGTNREITRQLWNRAHIKALKIAGLIACGQNIFNPVVNIHDVEWAINLVQNDIRSLSEKFEKGIIGKSSDDARQAEEIVRMIKFFVKEPWEKIGKYCADQRLYEAKIIPYAYLNKRLVGVAAFRNDKIGATNAIKKAIQVLIDSDFIRECPQKDMREKFGTVQKSYMVTNMKLIGEIE